MVPSPFVVRTATDHPHGDRVRPQNSSNAGAWRR